MSHSYTQLGSADLTRLRQLLVVFADAFEARQAYQVAPAGDAYLQRL